MKIMCLNCRGLGRPKVVREIRSLCELHRPWLVFLSETRFFNDRVDGLVRTLGLERGVGVGCYGRGGGLALLWSREVMVQLESYDKVHIDVTVRTPLPQLREWRFTGFYGESRRELRYRSWDHMKFLGSMSDLQWLCAGDFSEVLRAEEQIGGVGRSEAQMDGFRDAAQTCSLLDLGFIGLPYTWDNRQQDGSNIKVWLDRGLANGDFIDLFTAVKVWHVQMTESDHCCLVVECVQGQKKKRRKKQFRYENMWRRDPSYRPLVEAAWGSEAVPRLCNN